MDNRKMFRSDAFSKAWHEHQRSKQDLLRTEVMNPVLVENIGPLNGKTVLDAGCGNGFFIEELFQKKPDVVWACDISPFLISIVKKEHPNVHVQVVDLMVQWPFSDSFFDVVIAYNVIMDLPSIPNMIAEMARVLKKGGKAHIVIVHPLYNLFFNDQKAGTESIQQRLARYSKEESLLVDTVPGFPEFLVYRRPIQDYINVFIENGLKITKMKEVNVPEKLKDNPKYAPRIGVPVFAYFIVEKE